MPKSPKLDISYIAQLARIKLTPEEAERFSKQLADVLSYAEKLNKLDLKKIKPTFQTTGQVDVTRSDKLKAERTFTQDGALSGTKEKERGFFRVPKVLK